MTDRHLFDLVDGWALGFDDRQWMLMRARSRRGEREWHPVAFIATEKRILLRTMLENGVTPTAAAQARLDALPDRFRDWLAIGDELKEAA